MYKISRAFISLFGIGFLTSAPGTLGSLLSIFLLYFLKKNLSINSLIIFFIILIIQSIYLINIYSYKEERIDSPEIVIDEFLGIFLIVLFYDYFKFTNDIFMFLIIFILFRVFDISKIFPANWIDKKIKNSFGVILDDLIAAVYCIIFLSVINVYITY